MLHLTSFGRVPLINSNRIAIIGAHTTDLAFGLGDGMPWPRSAIKQDMARFKRITSDAPEGKKNLLIAGYKTFVGMGSKTLPNRFMASISRKIQHPTSFGNDTFGASSIELLLDYVEREIPNLHNVFFIGGEFIWLRGMNISNRAYITEIQKNVEDHRLLRRLTSPLSEQLVQAGFVLHKSNRIVDDWNGSVQLDFLEYIRK